MKTEGIDTHSDEEFAKIIKERTREEMILDYLMHPPTIANFRHGVRDVFDARDMLRDILTEEGIENVKLLRRHKPANAFGRTRREAGEIFDLKKFRESDDFSKDQNVYIIRIPVEDADAKGEKVSITTMARDIVAGDYLLFITGKTVEQNRALQLKLSCGRVSRRVAYGWDKD